LIASTPGKIDDFYHVSVPPLVWRGFLVIGRPLFIRERSVTTECFEVLWWEVVIRV
jgi:hypothetical protein